MDKGLNELLKWGIENSSAAAGTTKTGITAKTDTTSNDTPSHGTVATTDGNRGLNPDLLAALFGGPSDADLMKAAMDVITSKDADETLENRLTAFDNFEQLVESLDNANLMDKLALWAPLLGVLESDESELRRMAAWCVGTAVQNNQPSQAQLLAVGGVPSLVRVAASPTESEGVRRKAIYALSSACRNFQPAMDECLRALGQLETKVASLSALPATIDATNMDAVDEVINGLKADLQ